MDLYYIASNLDITVIVLNYRNNLDYNRWLLHSAGGYSFYDALKTPRYEMMLLWLTLGHVHPQKYKKNLIT